MDTSKAEIKSLILRFAAGQDSSTFSEQQMQIVVDNFDKLQTIDASLFRIIPLIHKAFITNGLFSHLPVDKQNYLKSHTAKANIVHLAAKAQIVKIAELFEKENIEIILLKAAAFNGWIYDEAFPRHSNDIDILVKERDWDKAVELLEEQMQRVVPVKAKPFDDLYETSFIPLNGVGGNVDLHKHLTYPYLFNIFEDDIWKEKIKHPSFQDINVFILRSEHAFIHQAIHAFRDLDFEKYNVLDSYLLSCEVDFNLLLVRAKKWEVDVAVFVMLNSTQKFLKCSLSQNIAYAIMPNILRLYLIRSILRIINSSFGVNSQMFSKFVRFLAFFLFSKSIKPSLRLIFEYLLRTIRKIK